MPYHVPGSPDRPDLYPERWVFERSPSAGSNTFYRPPGTPGPVRSELARANLPIIASGFYRSFVTTRDIRVGFTLAAGDELDRGDVEAYRGEGGAIQVGARLNARQFFDWCAHPTVPIERQVEHWLSWPEGSIAQVDNLSITDAWK